jgi:hypothetical protein
MTQVPFEVIGEQAEEDVGADARGSQWKTGRMSRSTAFNERKARST